MSFGFVYEKILHRKKNRRIVRLTLTNYFLRFGHHKTAFEAAVDLLEPPPIDYEAEKKAEEEAAAKAAEAEKKAKEKAAAKEAARKKAAAKKKALEEQAARVRAEAEAKKKAEEELIAAEKAAAEAKAAEEAKKKAKEEAAKRAKEEAKRKAEEEAAKKKAEEEAAKKRAEEEAAVAKAAEEAAQKKKKKKPKKEKKAAVDKEPVPPGKRAHTAEVYTAFKLRNCEADPSDEDYEKLREKTQKFFTKRYVCIFYAIILLHKLQTLISSEIDNIAAYRIDVALFTFY